MRRPLVVIRWRRRPRPKRPWRPGTFRSELNNPENDEDAVAFEKLMYRMGLAHIKAEDKEAMKPLAVDNAHAPLVKRKKKGSGGAVVGLSHRIAARRWRN